MRTNETPPQLTGKQQASLAFIRRYQLQHGRTPTLQALAEGIGIRSRGVAHRYVQALKAAGFLDAGQRGIRLLRPSASQGLRLPLLGKIAAGKPIEAIAGEDEVDLSDLFQPNNFAVRVQGDSMIEAGIMDGDTVIIRFCETAKDGDIVVALIDESETTLKRFQRSKKGRYVKLIPANKNMKPMVYEAERVRIQGVLVGQIRKY